MPIETADIYVMLGVLLWGASVVLSMLILSGIETLKSRPVMLQQRIDELLTLAHAAEVTLNGYDDRLADLQEARES